MAQAATSLDLEQLKQQAEAQQRRRAPPLSGKDPKKRRTDGQDADEDEQEQEGIVSRYTYAAADAIAAGSTCLMASCGFNRQRSAAKEMLSIVKPLLPEGTELQMVKVGCRGLAVVRLQPPVPVIPIVSQVLDQIQSGKQKHTRFCERIVPAETTCLLTSVALEAALTKETQAYLDSLQAAQQDSAEGADNTASKQQPVEFAVMYKSRGVDKQILAQMEKEAQQQQQQQQQREEQPAKQDKQQPEQQDGAAQADTVQEQQQQPAESAPGQGLDRQRIIDLAAAVMNKCCKDVGGAKVNLSKPQVVVMVEVVPLLRQQTACAVALLPSSIMSTGHKLKIKATSLESKEGAQKRKK